MKSLANFDSTPSRASGYHLSINNRSYSTKSAVGQRKFQNNVDSSPRMIAQLNRVNRLSTQANKTVQRAKVVDLDLEVALDHVEFRDNTVPRTRGIGGAHNSNEFAKYATEYQVQSTNPHATVPDVNQVVYKIPTFDRAGNPTGNWSSKNLEKTVYDGNIWTRDRLRTALHEALTNAANNNTTNPGEVPEVGWWEGNTSEGYVIRGTVRSGEIGTFFFQ